MCFSSFASFSIGTGLIGVGSFCTYLAIKRDIRYLPLSLMPIAVGIQQLSEGMIWKNYENGNLTAISELAFLYLFFVWVFWPAWAGLSSASLEPQKNRRRVFYGFSTLGLALGLSLYVPYIQHPDWLHVEVIRHSIAYSNSCLIPDQYLPRNLTYAIYMFFISAPLLLSSHKNLRFFGATLVIFVFFTYFFFLYAYASVLCFFAALSTLHILYIVTSDSCKDPADVAFELAAGDNQNHMTI